MNPSEITPCKKNTLVQPYKAEKQSSAGLVWETTNANIAPVSGTVIKASHDSLYRVGQVILFRRFSVDELKFITKTGENVVYLVEDQDVIAVQGDFKPRLWSKIKSLIK